MVVHKIVLHTGEVALVDATDAHLVREYRWSRGGTKNRYAAAYVEGRRVYLHRLVMGAGENDLVDHVNGKPLDCRRANLRIVTSAQNASNRSTTENSFGFRGVVFYPEKRKFQARLQKEGGVFRGPYRNEARVAAQDWDALARGLFGDFATYNFPRTGESGVKASLPNG